MQHLKSNKYGLHFRIRVPRQLQPIIQKTELKKTLHTTDKKLAARLAALYAVQAQEVFTLLKERLGMSKSPFIFDHKMVINRFEFPDGTKKTSYELDKENLQAELELLASKNLLNLEQQSAPQTPQIPAHPAMLRLSQAIELYITEQEATGKWKPSYVTDQRKLFELLLTLLPDKLIASYTRQDAVNVLNQLKKLPKHGKRGPTSEPISEKTRNLHMSKFSSLFNWLVADNKIPTNPFRGFAQKPKTSAKQQRDPFTREDIKSIFTAPIWADAEYKKPSEYWIALLALYTGARLTELCQLQQSDIVEIDGIHCLRITNESETMEKFLKTAAAQRIIPIHSKLIELGFLTFVNNCKDRLFPECKKFRDKYSHDYSKWFGKLKTDRVADAKKKTAHSFRHTLATELKLHNIQPELRAEILGHSYEAEGIKADMTANRYSKNYPPSVVQAAIELLNFDNEISAVKPYAQ